MNEETATAVELAAEKIEDFARRLKIYAKSIRSGRIDRTYDVISDITNIGVNCNLQSILSNFIKDKKKEN